MHVDEQPATEFRITAVCTVTDPAERQRRLAQVFDLIMDFGRSKRVAAATEANALAQTAS